MIDPGSLPGQTASLDFGEQTQFNRERQAIASAGRPAQGQPPQPGAPGPAPQATPGGQPVQPAAAVPPQASGQPVPQQQQTRPIDQSINMGNLFQRAPQLQEPYRTWLRRQGGRPGAGPELRALAAAIDHQRGPLDAPPKR